ncbi:MAG: WYL domain-containing protein [Bacteroidales bacterium]|nr:WYL domain-containing protein [Bacteroidales bacterium]
MTKNLINKYIWLVDIIRKAGREGITFNDIASKWREKDATEYAKRTFHNHINAVYELFGIEIKCIKGKNLNRYYISDNSDFKDISGFKNWLLDSLSLSCALEVKEPLKKRILLEEVPSGRENLTDILEAMGNGKTLTFTYKAFWMDGDKESTFYNVEPYALKMFKRRWYLLAKYGDNPLKTYALDRMSNIDEEFNNFTPPEDFDAEEFFSTCFGIICGGDEEPELIYLKVDNYQANYLRTLPLHHSQKEIERTDTHTVFSVYLRPTFDFKQELLWHGETMEVLKPESLRAEVARISRVMAERNS